MQSMANDLKLKPFKRIRISSRDQDVRSKRKICCHNLNDRFLASDVKRIIFTDEKDYTLEIAKNQQNNCVCGQQRRDIHPSRLYYESWRFLRKATVLAEVLEGKTNIHFIEARRAKVNSESYILLLDDNLLPNRKRLYPINNCVFQQDGALPSEVG